MKTMNIEDLQIQTESDENSDEEEYDSDECSELALQNLFPKLYTISAEQASLRKQEYIVNIAYRKEPSVNICTAISKECEIYSLTENQLKKTASLGPHSSNVVNVKFGSEYYTVFTASREEIKMWDLRTSQTVLQFKDNTLERPKPFIDFDITPNNRLLCAGTELIQSDAFLLFWDIRKGNLLGGYWDSHTDDITKINFHPVDNNILASGSTDGLINIYDLSKTTESDALKTCLNTESSVANLLWYTENNLDRLCCVTHTEDVQLWDAEEALRIETFSRSDITQAIQRKSSDFLYVANTHTRKSRDEVFLIAGSSFRNADCARGLNINERKLVPSFRLQGNKQKIRASCYDPESDLLITGGECGILSVWHTEIPYENNKVPLKSMSSKKKLHKKGPY